jgi:taurine transport system permease protein
VTQGSGDKPEKVATSAAESSARGGASTGDKSSSASSGSSNRSATARGDELPSAPPWWKTLRADPPFTIRLAFGAGCIFVILLLWWFVTRGSATEAIISPVKMPGPWAVWHDSELPSLLDAIIDTLIRVFLGVLIAAIVGVTLGVIAGANRAVSAALAPLVIFLRSIPMGALLPLMLILFSTGEKQKVMFIFFAIVPFVFSDTMKAVSIVPERYVETAQTLGASNRQILAKVLVPLALPDIITSIRFQVGLALGYIMLAEAVDTPNGLGMMIATSQREYRTENVYMLLFVIAILAFLLDLVLRTVQRGAFAWRKDL